MLDSPLTPSDDLPLFGRAILVIEDHPDSREMLATALRLVGAHVFVVANLKEAQLQLDLYLPSLIVCDLRLPDGTGAATWRVVARSACSSSTMSGASRTC